MTEYEQATKDFIEIIRKTKVATDYSAVLAEVEKNPELERQIREFRKKNFEMQDSVDGDRLFDEVDRFEAEYAEFRKIPLVSDFLEKELAFCRMFQEINEQISMAFAEDFDYSKGAGNEC